MGKKRLTEGRIRKWLDKIAYGIFNNANKELIDTLKKDKEMEKSIEDFEKASQKLAKTLNDFADRYNTAVEDEE